MVTLLKLFFSEGQRLGYMSSGQAASVAGAEMLWPCCGVTVHRLGPRGRCMRAPAIVQCSLQELNRRNQ